MRLTTIILLFFTGLNLGYAEENHYGNLDKKPDIRIWVHLCTKDQLEKRDNIESRIHKDFGKDFSTTVKFITVDSCVKHSVIKFFKPEDLVFSTIVEGFVSEYLKGIKVADVSRQYAGYSWIKQGHIEIWMSKLQKVDLH